MSPKAVWAAWFAAGVAIALALAVAIYNLPPVKFRLEWRLDKAEGIVRGWFAAGDTLPTPAGSIRIAAVPTAAPTHILQPSPTDQAGRTPTLKPTSTPIPDAAQLPAPEWEKQDWNNCGPATLALGLRSFGWEGDQFDVSDLLKPDRGDKNVNVEELVYYVRTRAGWLEADFRVGGDFEVLERFIAAGIPVIVEKGFFLAENDGGGGWAGHYLLLTGYDRISQTFLAQDTNPTTGGPDRVISYQELDRGWREFNRVFMFVYLPAQEPLIEDLLGHLADPDRNRELALESARAEIESDPGDPIGWFNLGTNLVYFERYGEAAEAYDSALSLGLPWRFTRYQFGPYIAYFHQGRTEDVIELADATLFRTYKAEESLLWRGWAHYRQGDSLAARKDFLAALEINPNYQDAQYAVEFLDSGG